MSNPHIILYIILIHHLHDLRAPLLKLTLSICFTSCNRFFRRTRSAGPLLPVCVFVNFRFRHFPQHSRAARRNLNCDLNLNTRLYSCFHSLARLLHTLVSDMQFNLLCLTEANKSREIHKLWLRKNQNNISVLSRIQYTLQN